MLNCFFPSVIGNIIESLYKICVHWPKQKDIKQIIMFIKIMLIKEDIRTIFNIFLLFIDIGFVILSIDVNNSFSNNTICKITKIFSDYHGNKA